MFPNKCEYTLHVQRFLNFIENVPIILINLVNALNNNVFLLIFVVFSSDER